MHSRQLAKGIEWVGAIDWDRRLFDALIPLPEGTTYNAYLATGNGKTALIDTVDPAFTDTLFARLDAAGLKELDYVIANHAEQDHSGSLPAILQRYPAATVLATAKCKTMLVDLLDVPAERIRAVDDGAKIDLGGTTLRFIHLPWVHWPETMVTFHEEAGVLFSCDLFGSHWATSDLVAKDETKLMEMAELYFATIMMPLRSIFAGSLAKIDALALKMIAPSHGPVIDKPAPMLSAYKKWVSPVVDNLVVIPYISMHGSTCAMARHLTDALTHRGVSVRVFDVTEPNLGELAIALNRAATIVIGSPIVLSAAHPKISYVAMLANVLRPKARFASVIGSFGWGGKLADQLLVLMPNLKVELLEPVVVKGAPKQDAFAALDRLADAIVEKHKTLGVAR